VYNLRVPKDGEGKSRFLASKSFRAGRIAGKIVDRHIVNVLETETATSNMTNQRNAKQRERIETDDQSSNDRYTTAIGLHYITPAGRVTSQRPDFLDSSLQPLIRSSERHYHPITPHPIPPLTP
jgi:hypothetical protein